MPTALASAVAAYGTACRAKFRAAVAGEPEEQLRGPVEGLIRAVAGVAGVADVVLSGETPDRDTHTRPDFAVHVRGAPVGFVELKAPGKGADPRRYRGHDKEQWDKLQSLPNLLYADGNQFALWRDGQLVGEVVTLDGDVQDAGAALTAPPGLLALVEDFLQWEPTPPKSAAELAGMTARLCRFLRDEVKEGMRAGSPALTALAADWRSMLFPEASDEQFADGYAQAVTFGLLAARARGIPLAAGLHPAALALGRTSHLIGAALGLLTQHAEAGRTLPTSLGVLRRVLGVVDWAALRTREADAWLDFYEDFLGVYDNALRKKTGSYYTPPAVVAAMTRLADAALRGPLFHCPTGLADPGVTVADPAVGTGTFLLGVLRHVAAAVERDQGAGAVPGAIAAAAGRLFGFEVQLGPFAVAQLRVHAEVLRLTADPASPDPKLFVTDTLADPWVEVGLLGSLYEPIAATRRAANAVKAGQPITVVLGNPPYKEKALGRGGWIEAGSQVGTGRPAPLLDWRPPRDWGVGTHAKHLRNLYVYFWRWATWKAFDHHPDDSAGVVCFITVAGFLAGPGFQKMRADLRAKADAIWVIDCSPEGHQPDVPTRIFQGVQQPVCIVLVARSAVSDPTTPAAVKFRALPEGPREAKFAALAAITLDGDGWVDGPTGWREPFLPAAAGAWAAFPKLDDLFHYNGSGVMPGRTWVIAPDAQTLKDRWATLVKAPADKKEELFHPHLRNGQPGDKHVNKVVPKPLAGQPRRPLSVARDTGDCQPPVRYGFRSFDRQWIIPDARLINQPNPELWAVASKTQVYLTAFTQESPSSGPSLTITGLIPDLHHYKGSFGGRVYPLWSDAAGTDPNVPLPLLEFLSEKYKSPVSAEDVVAYIAGIAAHPAYTARFQPDLAQPGLRIPITAKAKTFARAVEVGRRVVWLHTFGERFADGHPPGPPRLPVADAPTIPKDGAMPTSVADMPDELRYDAASRRLHVGTGYVANVPPAVWAYEVSGKNVLTQWFSYRKRDRSRPVMGDRRKPSELEKVRPDRWLAEYTTELLNLLNVLGLLVAAEPEQAAVLKLVCDGPLVPATELPATVHRTPGRSATPSMF